MHESVVFTFPSGAPKQPEMVPNGYPLDALWMPFEWFLEVLGIILGDEEIVAKNQWPKVMQEIREIPNRGCLPLKKTLFDPLLPHRLAGYAIGSNTPCVPEGTVADIIIVY